MDVSGSLFSCNIICRSATESSSHLLSIGEMKIENILNNTLRAAGFSYAKRERNHCEQLSTFPSSMRELVMPHMMHLMPSSFVNNFFAGSVSVQKNQNVSHQKC